MGRAIAACLLILPLPAMAETIAYRVAAIEHPRDIRYADDMLGPSAPVARVELGTAEDVPARQPLPERAHFDSVILIGSHGATDQVTFVDYEKRCEFLCGDELEECHYTAGLHWHDADIGTPLVALVGIEGTPADFTSLTDATAASTVPEMQVAVRDLAWPDNTQLGLEIGQETSVFDITFYGSNPYHVDFEAPDCRWIPYPGTELARLACNSAEVLLHGGAPLLYSAADYNVSMVRVVNRFLIEGQEYFTVMLALKAYTAVGVLTRDGDGWRFLVKSADWALLC